MRRSRSPFSGVPDGVPYGRGGPRARHSSVSCSGAGVPIAQIVSDAGYVMISPSNTAPSLTDPDQAWKPGYLRTALDAVGPLFWSEHLAFVR